MLLKPSEYQIAIRWWLDIDTSCKTTCPFCPRGPPGHSEVTSRHGGDVVMHHNHIHDVFVELCCHAHLSVGVEKGHGFIRDHNNACPADVRIAGQRKPCCTRHHSHHSPLPSWVNQADWLMQLPLQQKPTSSSLNVRIGVDLYPYGSRIIWEMGQRGTEHILKTDVPPAISLSHPKTSVMADI